MGLVSCFDLRLFGIASPRAECVDKAFYEWPSGSTCTMTSATPSKQRLMECSTPWANAWASATDIPADKSSYGIGAELSDRALQRTRELIDALASPGAARTADERRIADYVAAYTDEATFNRTMQNQAIKKRGTPEHLAALIAFLASDDAELITGQTILCDGGAYLH